MKVAIVKLLPTIPAIQTVGIARMMDHKRTEPRASASGYLKTFKPHWT
jgi:hypothetical protein